MKLKTHINDPIHAGTATVHSLWEQVDTQSFRTHARAREKGYDSGERHLRVDPIITPQGAAL